MYDTYIHEEHCADGRVQYIYDIQEVPEYLLSD